MQLTTVSQRGIGSANAVIFVRHTPQDAKAFCVKYALDNSRECVKLTMAEVKVRDRVTANCKRRTWTDMYGQSYAFHGAAKQSDDVMADYLMANLESGNILDGSSASGYWAQLNIFKQLCPGVAD